ncbi:MAG: FtsQ-type POTRA domain-containing protein [Oscillibacter sp.]|nr:FtsQ-type POTRA domain-containing protein [Oscillibacter sp.]
MARRKHSKRRRRGVGFFYKLLSVLLICAAIILALTLFFRVDAIVVTGQQRYSEEEIQEASGVELGSNLYLLNKYDVVQRIISQLPYIESIRVNRKLPDTLVIDVREGGRPFVLVQDGAGWLISSSGKIVEQIPESEAGNYGRISGCQLLAPSVGEPLALATEYATQESSLLSLLKAITDAGLTEEVDGVRLDDLSYLKMDYMDRFTVRMDYGADYEWGLKILVGILESGKIQSNMTGTLDLRVENDRVSLIQNVR